VSYGYNKDLMKTLRPIRLNQLKIEAKLLHKALKTDFVNTASRYLAHPLFSDLTFSELQNKLPQLQLKHAYFIIAHEYGFKRWEDLKSEVVKNDLLFRSNGVGFIYKWFKTYPETLNYHKQHGGYLLQFWKDYVICGHEYIQILGLDQYPKLWQDIGYNWVEPLNATAYQQLYKKALLLYTSL